MKYANGILAAFRPGPATIGGGVIDDLLAEPETAYIELDNDRLVAEQELAERYRSFVGEMLRLSLAGVAAFAFIDKFSQGSLPARFLAGFGVLAFAVSIAFALRFLYLASEALRWYITGLRHYAQSRNDPERQLAKDMLNRREEEVSKCHILKIGAAWGLFVGALFMALATMFTMISPLPASSPPSAQQSTKS